MQISEEKINEVVGIDPNSTISMKIDESNNKKLMLILSSNLYQNPIGSIVREYVSNALDAHKEIGNTDPIHVKLIRENGRFIFKVEDNGIGLSPDRVENVFAKYLSSTKEKDDTQLGYYGLGSKSALAYVDSFIIHSRYENKIYSYMMLKSEEGTDLSLLDINDSVEPNGVSIVINLKSDNDYNSFYKEIESQLAYFEGIYVEDEYQDFDNEYKIIKGSGWKYSELNKDPYMHISLQQVYYPLDFQKLNIDPIKIPIALEFTLQDGIFPNPARESFLYSPATKELILERIKVVCKEFIEKYNESLTSVDDINTAHRLHTNLGEIILYKEEINGSLHKEIRIKVPKAVEKLAGIEMKSVALTLFPNLNTEKLYSNMTYFLQEYKIFGEFTCNNYKTKFGKKGSREYLDLFASSIDMHGDIYLLNIGETLTKQQITYLKWKDKNFIIIRKHSHVKLGKHNKNNFYSPDTYKGLLELTKFSKNNWRSIITEYQEFIKSNYIDKFLKLEDIVPSQEYLDWKETQKKERKVTKRDTKEQFSYSTIRRPLKASKSLYVLDSTPTIYLKDLDKQPGIFVYTTEDDSTIPLEMFRLFKEKMTKAKLVMLSDRNYQKISKLKPIHNWVKIEDFWKKKNRELSELLTNHLLNTIWDQDLNNSPLHNKSNLLDPKGYKLYQKVSLNCRRLEIKNVSEDYIFSLVKLYGRSNWLNNEKLNEFKQVFKDVHRFDFLDMFNFRYNHDQKLIKNFALTIYLKLVKEEKEHGKFAYKRYDMDQIVQSYLEDPKEDIDIHSAIDPEENDEILITDELIEEEAF